MDDLPSAGVTRVVLTAGRASPGTSPGRFQFGDGAAIEPISEQEAREALASGFVSALGLPQTARLFATRLGVPVEQGRPPVKCTPADLIVYGEYDWRCEQSMDVLPDDAPIAWYRVSVRQALTWRSNWARVTLSRRHVIETAKQGGYIFVDPELDVAFLDAARCQGHEDVFPISMAFQNDDVAAGRLRDFLEPGDWTGFVPPGPRSHDGIYRGYFIDWTA